MTIKPVALVVAMLVAFALSGCTTPSAAATKSPLPLPTRVPAASGTFNEALAYQSAWHVEGKGKYFAGSVDTCDLTLAISIEDAAALSNPDSNVPVFGAVFRDGQISYGTVWPTAIAGTGIESGTGRYAISYDSSGLPTVAHGTATITWHDPKKKPAVSTRTDSLTLTFTKEPRAGHCP